MIKRILVGIADAAYTGSATRHAIEQRIVAVRR